VTTPVFSLVDDEKPSMTTATNKFMMIIYTDIMKVIKYRYDRLVPHPSIPSACIESYD
jgi:hypothetical protein